MTTVIKNDKTAIIWLYSAHLVCDVYSGFVNPLMPFIASKLGFSMAIATILVAITQICSNMLQPLFGFLADNNLKRFFIFWGLILSSIFIPIAPSSPNLFILTIFLILGCLGGSFFHPQSMGFVNYFSGKNCSNNMGIFVSLGSLGFAFGPLIAAYVTQVAGLEKICLTSIIGVFLAIIMFLFVPKLSDKEVVQKQSFVSSFKEILFNSQMQLLMVVSMMKTLVTSSSCILLPFLWKSMGYTPFYIGFALFLFVFAGSIGSFLSPKLEKIFGAKPVIYFSMWSSLPLLYLFSITYKTKPIFSLIMFAIIGFTTMLAQPVTLVWAQKILPKYKSIVAGFINGFCWGVIAIIISFLGAFAEKFGITNVLIILAIFPLFASYSVKYLKNN